VSIFRTGLERFSRNIIVKRRLPKTLGRIPLIVSPGAALSYWKGDLSQHDPMLFTVVHKFVGAGQSVWDVGANVGLFTFAAAYKVGVQGRVLAIEADIWCVTLLRRSCQLSENRTLPVDILPVAVANSVDIARFHIAQRGRAANHLATVNGSSQSGGIRETQLVPCISLDWLAERYPPPDFIKIDIEAAEKVALEGATTILSQIRPAILCEVSAGNQQAVTQILQQHGYQLYDAQDFTKGVQDQATFNTLALPFGRSL